MKKLCFFICAVVASTASADNTITSKEYVDGQVAGLQTQIPAKNTNTVVTNTGTAGTIGEKAIYDTTAAYGAQSDALVTAGAFNSAVQNALESEFVCVEWQGSVHDNAHCLLYEVRGAYQPSKNLFDENTAVINYYPNAEGSLSPSTTWLTTDYINVEGMSDITVSCISNYNGNAGRDFVFYDADKNVLTHGVHKSREKENMDIVFSCVVPPNAKYVRIGFIKTDSNKQVEAGTLATPYVPYGNVYMPQAN